MNFHWGKKIAVFYSAFVIMISTFAILAIRQTNDLESEDYYEQEIKYQSRIERLQNSRSLNDPLRIQYDVQGKTVNIYFPENLEVPTGEIVFYRPSDKSLDFKLSVDCQPGGTQQVPTSSLKSGLWQIQIEWTAGNAEYYDELNVRI